MNFFSLNITFFSTYQSSGVLSLFLYTAEYSNSTLLINGDKVIETGYVQCHSTVYGSNSGYYNATESCCREPTVA